MRPRTSAYITINLKKEEVVPLKISVFQKKRVNLSTQMSIEITHDTHILAQSSLIPTEHNIDNKRKGICSSKYKTKPQSLPIKRTLQSVTVPFINCRKRAT